MACPRNYVASVNFVIIIVAHWCANTLIHIYEETLPLYFKWRVLWSICQTFTFKKIVGGKLNLRYVMTYYAAHRTCNFT